MYRRIFLYNWNEIWAWWRSKIKRCPLSGASKWSIKSGSHTCTSQKDHFSINYKKWVHHVKKKRSPITASLYWKGNFLTFPLFLITPWKEEEEKSTVVTLTQVRWRSDSSKLFTTSSTKYLVGLNLKCVPISFFSSSLCAPASNIASKYPLIHSFRAISENTKRNWYNRSETYSHKTDWQRKEKYG